eukprot:2493887-Rhodomonas_salina.1
MHMDGHARGLPPVPLLRRDHVCSRAAPRLAQARVLQRTGRREVRLGGRPFAVKSRRVKRRFKGRVCRVRVGCRGGRTDRLRAVPRKGARPLAFGLQSLIRLGDVVRRPRQGHAGAAGWDRRPAPRLEIRRRSLFKVLGIVDRNGQKPL